MLGGIYLNHLSKEVVGLGLHYKGFVKPLINTLEHLQDIHIKTPHQIQHYIQDLELKIC